jgi:hypothetical protein
MIKNFTDKFLTYSRVTLFILFAMASFNLYDSNYPSLGYIVIVINLIGGISFLAWVYAIGHKANERLKKQNIQLRIFNFFNFGFVIIIGSVLTMFFLSQGSVTYGDDSGNLTYQLTYTRPGQIALVFAAGLIFTVWIAAKILVSAEENKEVEFGDYFKTLLLFAFSWLGLWWIQPRVQKL